MFTKIIDIHTLVFAWNDQFSVNLTSFFMVVINFPNHMTTYISLRK